jgi:hypothetical protein
MTRHAISTFLFKCLFIQEGSAGFYRLGAQGSARNVCLVELWLNNHDMRESECDKALVRCWKKQAYAEPHLSCCSLLEGGKLALLQARLDRILRSKVPCWFAKGCPFALWLNLIWCPIRRERARNTRRPSVVAPSPFHHSCCMCVQLA